MKGKINHDLLQYYESDMILCPAAIILFIYYFVPLNYNL